MFTRIRKLPWPMSKIDRDLLHELWVEGQDTKRPITEIVAEAVITHLNQRFETTKRAAASNQSSQFQAPLPAA